MKKLLFVFLTSILILTAGSACAITGIKDRVIFDAEPAVFTESWDSQSTYGENIAPESEKEVGSGSFNVSQSVADVRFVGEPGLRFSMSFGTGDEFSSYLPANAENITLGAVFVPSVNLSDGMDDFVIGSRYSKTGHIVGHAFSETTVDSREALVGNENKVGVAAVIVLQERNFETEVAARAVVKYTSAGEDYYLYANDFSTANLYDVVYKNYYALGKIDAKGFANAVVEKVVAKREQEALLRQELSQELGDWKSVGSAASYEGMAYDLTEDVTSLISVDENSAAAVRANARQLLTQVLDRNRWSSRFGVNASELFIRAYANGKALYNFTADSVLAEIDDLIGSQAKVVVSTPEKQDFISFKLTAEEYVGIKVNGDLTYNKTDLTQSIAAVEIGTGEVQYAADGFVNAGSYSVEVTVPGKKLLNKKSNLKQTLQFTIKPAPITVKAKDIETVYGETKPYEYEILAGQLYEGDDLGVTYEREEGSNAREQPYVITPSVSNANYSATLVNGGYKINKASYTNVPLIGTLSGRFGQTLADVKLPYGWSWLDPETALDRSDVKYVAVFGSDPNYLQIMMEVEVIVSATVVELPVLPEYVYDGTSRDYVSNSPLYYVVSGGKDMVDAGEYEIVLSLSDKINYKWPDGTAEDKKLTLTIKGQQISLDGVTLGNLSNVYNGNVQLPTVGNLSENATFAFDYAEGDCVNAGTYNVTVKFKANKNYCFAGDASEAAKSVNIEIIPKTVSVEWESEPTLVYNGSMLYPAATANSGIDGDEIKLAVQGGVNAGQYTATAMFASSNEVNISKNYVLENTTSAVYQIARRPITVKAADKQSVYGDSLKLLSYTCNDALVAGDSFVSGVGADVNKLYVNAYIADKNGNEITDTSKLNAATYKIKLVASALNYDITTVDAEYTVNKRDITVTAEDKSVTYGYAFAESGFTATATNLASWDSVAALTLGFGCAYAQGNGVGEYAISVTASGANYNVTAENSGTLTVNKRKITVKIDDKNSVYGGARQPLTYTVTSEEKEYGSENAITLTSAATGLYADAKTYSINVSSTDGNYEVSGDLFGEYVIIPASLTLVNVPVNVTYNSEAHSPGVTVTTVNSQDYTVYWSMTDEFELGSTPAESCNQPVKYTNAGSYTAYYMVVADNHEPVKASVTVDIARKEVLLPAMTASLVYNGSEQDVTNGYTFEGLASISGNKAKDVNSYTATFTVDGNHIFAENKESEDFTWAITKATLNVTVKNINKTYKDHLNVNELNIDNLTIEGYLGTDDISVVNSASLKFTTDYTSGNNAGGSYFIKAGGLSAANYNFTYTDGKVIVGKAKVTVPTACVNLVYNAAQQTGVKHSYQDHTTLYTEVIEGDSAEQKTNAGSYIAVYKLKDSVNYKWSVTPSGGESANLSVTWSIAKLTVKAADYLTLNLNGFTRIYDKNVKAVTADNLQVVSGKIDIKNETGFGFTVSYNGSSSAPSSAGNYAVTVTVQHGANSNYTVDASNATLTGSFVISKAEVDQPSVSGSFTYTGSEYGVPTTEDYNTLYILVSGTEKATNAGDYIAKYALTSAENYKWKGKTGADESDNIEISWSIAKAEINNVNIVSAWTYNGKFSADVTATTVNGQNLTVKMYKDEGRTTDADYKTVAESESTVYYTLSAPNHNDVKGSFVITINKADYTGITVDATSVTYVKDATVSSITLPANYSWKNQDEKLVVNKSSYVAVYNADSANYNDFELSVTVTVRKAEVAQPIGNSLTYNGAEQQGIAHSKDIDLYAYVSGTEKATNANDGKYSVVYKLNDAANYKWEGLSGEYESASLTVEWQLVRAAGTVRDIKELGLESVKTYDNTAFELPSIEQIITLGDGVLTVTHYDENGAELNEAPTAVGHYRVKFTVSNKDGGNYSYTTLIDQTYSYQIIPAGAITFIPANGGLNAVTGGYTGVYRGSAFEVKVQGGGLLDTDIVTYTVSTDGTNYVELTSDSIKNVGTYYVKAEIKTYNGVATDDIDDVTATITVTKAQITVTASNYTVTYGDAAPNYTYTVAGIVDDDATYSVTVTSTYAAGSSVIEDGYAVNASGFAFADASYASNYDMDNIAYVGGTVTVNKKELSITVNATATYGNAIEATEPIYTGLLDKDESLKGLTYSYNNSEYVAGDTKAGTILNITAPQFVSNYNVIIQNTAEANAATVTVQKLEITASWTVPEGNKYSYNGNAQKPTVSFNLWNGNAAVENTDYTLSYSSVASVDSGSYTATLKLKDTVNYTLINDTLNYSIEKLDITVTLLDQTFTYGDSINLSVAKDQGWQLTSGALASGETFWLTLSKADDVVNAEAYSNAITLGTYGVKKADNSASNNYNINIDRSANIIVAKRTVTVALSISSIIYGDAVDWSDNYTVTENGAEYTKKADVKVVLQLKKDGVDYSNTAILPAGEYEISLASFSENYNIATPDAATYTVNQKAVTITVATTATYGDNVTLPSGGTLNETVPTEDEAKFAAIQHVSRYASKAPDVGKHTDTYDESYIDSYINNVDDSLKANYEITVVQELTVEAREITLNVANRNNSVYGDNTQGVVANETVSVTSGSVIDGDVAYTAAVVDKSVQSVALAIAEGASYDNVGEYYVQISANNKNYTVYVKFAEDETARKVENGYSEQGGSYKIVARTVYALVYATATYLDEGLTYTGETKFEGDGLANGHTADDVFKLYTNYKKGSQVSAEVTLDADLINKNYKVYIVNTATSEYVEGEDNTVKNTVKIAPKQVAVPELVTGLTYSGEAQQIFTYNVDEIKLADETLVAGMTMSDGKFAAINACENYSVTLALVDSANYVWKDGSNGEKSVTFTIAKAHLTVTITGETVIYSGIEQKQTTEGKYALSGNISTDAIIVSLTHATAINAGQYKITAKITDYSNGVEGTKFDTNYTLDYNEAYFEITKAALKVKIDVAVIYGDDVPAVGSSSVTVGYDGFVNGETAAVLGGSLVYTTDYTKGAAAGATYNVSSLSGLTSDNYAITFDVEKSTFTVSEKLVDIVWGATSGVYSGRTHVLNPYFVGYDGENVNVDYTVGEGKTLQNAGKYTLTAIDVENYSFNNSTFDYEITKKIITSNDITWEWGSAENVDGVMTYTYNGQQQAPTATFTDLANGNASVSFAIAGQGTVVGGYTLTLTLPEVYTANYAFAEGANTMYYAIKQAQLSASVSVAYPVGRNYYVTGDDLVISISGLTFNGVAYTDGYSVAYDGKTVAAVYNTATFAKAIGDDPTCWQYVALTIIPDNDNISSKNTDVFNLVVYATVTFENEGTVIDTQYVAQGGSVAATAPTALTKPATDEKHFTFSYWSSSNGSTLSNVTANTVFTAVYAETDHCKKDDCSGRVQNDANGVYLVSTCGCGHSVSHYVIMYPDIDNDPDTETYQFVSDIATDGLVVTDVITNFCGWQIGNTFYQYLNGNWQTSVADNPVPTTGAVATMCVYVYNSNLPTSIDDIVYSETSKLVPITVNTADINTLFTITATKGTLYKEADGQSQLTYTNAGEYSITIKLKDNVYWFDGSNYTTGDYIVGWIVTPAPVDLPTLIGAPNNNTYYATGNEITAFNDTYANIEVIGTTSATLAGAYTATFTPNDNYKWSHVENSNTISITWYIVKNKVNTPTIKTAYDYNNGDKITVVKPDGTEFVVEGALFNKPNYVVQMESDENGNSNYSIGATNAGTYTITLEFTEAAAKAYEWADESFNGTLTWTVNKATVTVPTAKSLTYNGSEQTAFVSNDLYKASGDKQTNAGSYTATFTLNDTTNYKWANSETASVTVSWSIAKKSVAKPDLDEVYKFYVDGTTKTLISFTAEEVKAFDTITVEKENGTAYTATTASGYVLTASEVDAFTITVPLNSNYIWSDDTSDALVYTREIANGTVAVPTVTTPLTYTGAGLAVASNVSNVTITVTYQAHGSQDVIPITEGSEVSPTNYVVEESALKVLNAGIYTVTFAPKQFYVWNDKTFAPQEFTVTVNKREVQLAGNVAINYNDTIVTNNGGIVTAYGLSTDTYSDLVANGNYYNRFALVWADGSSNAVPTVNWGIGVNGSGNPDYIYTEDQQIKQGSTYYSQITLVPSTITVEIDGELKDVAIHNYVWSDSTDVAAVKDVYFLFRTVYTGERATYYTIEEALNGVSSGKIYLEGSTNTVFTRFTTLSFYSGESYYAVKSEVDLYLRSTDGNTSAVVNENVTETEPVYSVLSVPSCIRKLDINGTLTVAAYIGEKDTSTSNMGAVGKRSVVMNDGNIFVKSGGKILAYGFIKGNGIIEAESGSEITDVMRMYDFLGGTRSSEIAATASNKLFPINSYSIHNVACKTKICLNATYIAYYALNVGESYDGCTGTVVLVGSDGLFEFSGSNSSTAHILKTTIGVDQEDVLKSNQILGQIDKLELNGNFIDNSITVKLKVLLLLSHEIKTSTEMAMPISQMDITIASGTTTLQNNSYKFFPGAKATVKSGATLNVSGNASAVFIPYEALKGDYITYAKSPPWYSISKSYTATESGFGFKELLNNGGITDTVILNGYKKITSTANAYLDIESGANITVGSSASIGGYVKANDAVFNSISSKKAEFFYPTEAGEATNTGDWYSPKYTVNRKGFRYQVTRYTA